MWYERKREREEGGELKYVFGINAIVKLKTFPLTLYYRVLN